MAEWTPNLVEARLAEAAWVLGRLPEPQRQGYFNVWPEMIHSFADKVWPAAGSVDRRLS